MLVFFWFDFLYRIFGFYFFLLQKIPLYFSFRCAGLCFCCIFLSAARGFAFAVFFFPLRGALLCCIFLSAARGFAFAVFSFRCAGALFRGTDVFLMDRTVLVQYIGESKKNLHVLGVSQVKRVLGT